MMIRLRLAFLLLSSALVVPLSGGCSGCSETPGDAGGEEGEGEGGGGEGEGEAAGEGEGEGGANQAPIVTIAAPANNATFRQGASVQFNCSAVDPEGGVIDNAAYAWTSSVDGALGTGASIQNALVSIGTHTISCSATDDGGATGSAAITVEVFANALPVVTITGPRDGSFFLPDASIDFTGFATDLEDGAVPSASLRWTNNGDVLGAGATVRTALPLGVHVIALIATDADGAEGRAEITVTITNNLPPVCNVNAPADGTSVIAGQSVTFVAGCSDPDGTGAIANASFSWESDLQGALGFGASITQALVTVGTHVVTVCAVDTVDATVSGCTDITVVVRANQPPTASIVAPGAGSTVDACNRVDLRCNVSDPDGQNVTVRWLEGATVIGTGNNTSYDPTFGGAHTVQCEATDTLGAIATATVSFNVTSPSVAIDNPADNAVFAPGQSITLRGVGCSSAVGDLTGAQLTWMDGNTVLGTGSPLTLAAGLSPGTHEVVLIVNDGSGQASTSVTIFVSTPPTVTITSPADNTLVNSNVATSFTGTANDAQDGALTGTWSDSAAGVFGSGNAASTTLAPGKHLVTFSATDSAGQTGSDTVPVFATPNGAAFSTLFQNRTLGTAVVDVLVVGNDIFAATSLGVTRLNLDMTVSTALTAVNSDLPNSNVRDLTLLNDGTIAVATADGLAIGCDRDLNCARILDDNSGVGFQTNDMRAVVQLSNGRLVVATTNCLTVIETGANTGLEFCDGDGGGDQAQSNGSRRLAVDANDDVLVAWDADNAASVVVVGGNLTNDRATEFTTIDRDSGLPSDTVFDVAFGPAGEQLFATSAGLAVDAAGTVSVFNTARGLPSNDVRAVAVDVVVIAGVSRTVAWAAPAGGLGRVDLASGSVVGMTTADGLPSNDLRAVAVDVNHRKIVGTNNGAFSYSGL